MAEKPARTTGVAREPWEVWETLQGMGQEDHGRG